MFRVTLPAPQTNVCGAAGARCALSLPGGSAVALGGAGGRRRQLLRACHAHWPATWSFLSDSSNRRLRDGPPVYAVAAADRGRRCPVAATVALSCLPRCNWSELIRSVVPVNRLFRLLHRARMLLLGVRMLGSPDWLRGSPSLLGCCEAPPCPPRVCCPCDATGLPAAAHTVSLRLRWHAVSSCSIDRLASRGCPLPPPRPQVLSWSDALHDLHLLWRLQELHSGLLRDC